MQSISFRSKSLQFLALLCVVIFCIWAQYKFEHHGAPATKPAATTAPNAAPATPPNVANCAVPSADGTPPQPRVLPGDTWAAAESAYGKAPQPIGSARVLRTPGYTVLFGDRGTGTISTIVVGARRGGLPTIDGIQLGHDSFAAIAQQLESRHIFYREAIHHEPGIFALSLSFPSACGAQFISEYGWGLTETPAIARQIGTVAPLHSNPFLNQPVATYLLRKTSDPDPNLNAVLATHK